MMQVFLYITEMFFIFIAAYMTFALSKALKAGGTGMLTDLYVLLERTPASDAFLMFAVQAIFIATALASTFGRISNHAVISLDIVYLISSLLLILYHALKEANHPSVKEA